MIHCTAYVSPFFLLNFTVYLGLISNCSCPLAKFWLALLLLINANPNLRVCENEILRIDLTKDSAAVHVWLLGQTTYGIKSQQCNFFFFCFFLGAGGVSNNEMITKFLLYQKLDFIVNIVVWIKLPSFIENLDAASQFNKSMFNVLNAMYHWNIMTDIHNLASSYFFHWDVLDC